MPSLQHGATARLVASPGLEFPNADLAGSGHTDEMTEPTTWAELALAAEQLDQSGAMNPFEVEALRRRTLLSTVDGLWLGDMWTDVFEPVRRRFHLFGRWRQVQSIDEAEAGLEVFLRLRPDLH